MKSGKLLVVMFACIFLAVPFPVYAQIFKTSTQPSAQATTVRKDANAVAVLTKLISTNNWTKATVPSDAVIMGTITRDPENSSQSGSFTIKARGQDQYQYSENGSLRLIANGPAGAMVTADGKARRIPAHSALSSRGLVLPMTSVLGDWDAPDVDVVWVGPSSVNSESCVGIQLTRRHPDSDPLARVRRLIAPVIVWVSTTRNVVVRGDYYRPAVDGSALQAETILYSDYRSVNGLAVPIQQDILIGEQHILRLQFSSVQFNTGLADADFNVAALIGGAR